MTYTTELLIIVLAAAWSGIGYATFLVGRQWVHRSVYGKDYTVPKELDGADAMMLGVHLIAGPFMTLGLLGFYAIHSLSEKD